MTTNPNSVILTAFKLFSFLLQLQLRVAFKARAAPLRKNYRSGSIGAIITLNTPHLAHPYGGDGYLEEFYQQINSFWSNPKSWQGTLKNIVLASIAGGSRDHVVRGDLTSLGNLTPFGKSVHVWSTSLPGVWIQMDHDAIVWCGQLIAVLSRAIMSLHSSTKHGKKRRKIYVIFFIR